MPAERLSKTGCDQTDNIKLKVKVKLSHFVPGQALRAQEVEVPRTFRHSAHEGGEVVSPKHRSPFALRKYCWYSFLLEVESTPGPFCGQKDYVNEKS